MTNTKHTPGPWKAVEHHGAIDVMGVGSGVCRVFTDPNQNSLPTMPQARANARLIAAAPDLLAALRKAMEWVEHVEAVAWDSIPEGMRGDNGAAWAIRSAIARATGGGA